MGVRTSCESPEAIFDVDAVNLDRQYFKENEDKCVKVFAEIGAENTVYPDITVEKTVWIETAQQRKTREQFVAGGWKSIGEFNNAKKDGIESRYDWLALQAERRMKEFADAEWEKVESWPAGLAGFAFSPGSQNLSQENCDNLIRAKWSEWKKLTYRLANLTIYDPSSQSRYTFLIDEEMNQRWVVIEKLWLWRSKKSPRHYLLYSVESRFESWAIDKNGTFRPAVLQRNGEVIDGLWLLKEIAAIGAKTRPDIPASEYSRYGIVPDDMEEKGGEIKRCDRRAYQTIENIPFVVKSKGDARGQYLTIREVLQAK